MNIETGFKKFGIPYIKLKYLHPRVQRHVLAAISTFSTIVGLLMFKDEVFSHSETVAFVSSVLTILISMYVIELPIRIANYLRLPHSLLISPIGIHIKYGKHIYFLESANIKIKQYTSLRHPYYLKQDNALKLVDGKGATIAYIENKDNTMEDKIKNIFSQKERLEKSWEIQMGN